MKKRMLLIAVVLLVFIAAYTMVDFMYTETPGSSINQARKMLSEADKMEASIYASESWESAKMYYDSAMVDWQEENQRLFILRDFAQTITHAKRSVEFSEKAIRQAKMRLAKEDESLGIRITRLKKKIHEFENLYGNFPYISADRNDLSKSKLLLAESILAYEKLSYVTCQSKLDTAEMAISSLQHRSEEKLTAYFNDFDKWTTWVTQSIAHSKKYKSYCIIIDKFARSCSLYHNGQLIKQVEAELGVNWIGDKNQQGDKSTPEGLYKIVSKKSQGESRFYKAFLLDYPNEDDKKRFELNKKKGHIKQDAKIGNLIEIHGDGGKGIDWTDGCIALKNADMDALFKVCPTGTRVTIVGSSKPLNTIFSN